MLVVLLVITALIAGSSALVAMQVTSTRAASLTQTKAAALHCAEAGLAGASSVVAMHYAQWNSALASGTQPSWLAVLDRDLDDDGAPDFELVLGDNQDEIGAADDPTTDNDLAIYVVSTCVRYADVPARIAALVRYGGGGTCYQAQLGGCGGNNNGN